MPIHKAAVNGNPTCLLWIIEKWEEVGIPLDIDALDAQGMSPLYLVCWKGFTGADGMNSGGMLEIMKKRMECV